MRAIFKDCLPIGEDTVKAEEYFNGIQQVIDNNDFKANTNPLRREDFDHDNPDIQYTYLSDALFKERSSKHQLRALRQDVGDQPDVYEGEIPQSGSTVSADPPSVSQCEGDGLFEYGDQDSDDPSW